MERKRGKPDLTRKILLIAIILTSFLNNNHMSLAQPEIPDIWYFSHNNQAFIIERADGEFTRILATHKKAKNGDYAVAGWSSSGRWFAWSTEPSSDLPEIPVATVVSRDGNKLITLVDATLGKPLTHLQWSPADDFLLVSQRFYPNYISDINDASPEEVHRRNFVYDPDSEQIIVEFPSRLEHGTWLDDGQHILFEESTIDSAKNWQLFEINADVGTPKLQIKREAECLSRNQQVFVVDSFLIHNTCGKSMEVINPSTMETMLFEAPGTSICHVDWNESQDNGILYFAQSRDILAAYFLSLETKRFEFIAEVSASANVRARNVGPLSASKSNWSPDNAAVAILNDSSTITLLFPNDGHTQQVELADIDDTMELQFYTWHPYGNRLLMSGTTSHGEKSAIYEYNIETNEFSLITEKEQEYAPYYHLSFSADTNYFAYTNLDHVVILNESYQQLETLGVVQGYNWFNTDWDGESAPPFVFLGVSWHESQNWFFMETAWDYGLNRHVNVANTTGNSQRELQEIYLPKDSYGWLPPLSEK
ncbi:MAG: hypothetical protein L0154_28035 [Chloroflexi bacterium]|nr:hypothetical protein [Chloroflexota bacterium]